MVTDSQECLPISEDNLLLSLHFSPPSKQVLFTGASFEKIDIASDSFGDEPDAGTVQAIGTDQVRVAHLSRVSISFDVSKVDDQSAAQFIHKLKGLLDDPELLLL